MYLVLLVHEVVVDLVHSMLLCPFAPFTIPPGGALGVVLTLVTLLAC